ALATARAADVLGVVAEDRFVEPAPEAVDEEVLEVALGTDRQRTRLQVARDDAHDAKRAQVPERARAETDRVIEEPSQVKDPRQPRPNEQRPFGLVHRERVGGREIGRWIGTWPPGFHRR